MNGYLTKPTTRLARYPLLLEAVLKHTPDDSPDKVALPKAVAMVREFLKAVNSESGKTENRFNLLQLDQALVFKQGEQVVRGVYLFLMGTEILPSGPSTQGGGSGNDLQGHVKQTWRRARRKRRLDGIPIRSRPAYGQAEDETGAIQSSPQGPYLPSARPSSSDLCPGA